MQILNMMSSPCSLLKFLLLLNLIAAVDLNIGNAEDEVETVVSGTIVDSAGQPAVGAIVTLCRHSQDVSSGKQTTADAQGRFSLTTIATSKAIEAMHLESKNADGSEIGFCSLRATDAKLDLQSIEVRLSTMRKARVLVIDHDDRPIEDAKVCARLGDTLGRIISAKTDASGIAELYYTEREPIALVFALKDGAGFEYRLFQPAQQGFGAEFSAQSPERLKLSGVSPLKLKMVDDEKRPLKGIKIYPLILRKSVGISQRSSDLNLSLFLRHIQYQTDANGEVSFAWLPSWHKGNFTFMTSGGDELVHSVLYVDPKTSNGTHEAQLDRTVPIRGKVVDVDGKPVKGITISASNEASSRAETAKTDEQGNYEVLVAPNHIYMVIVKDRQWASATQDGFAVLPKTPVEGKDFKLRKATRIYGKVQSGFWLADTPNHRVVVLQKGKSLGELKDVKLPEPPLPNRLLPTARPNDYFETWTDQKGNFELFVGDGEFVRISDGGDEEFKVEGDESIELNIKSVTKSQTRVTTDSSAPFMGLIVDGVNAQPLRDCRVTIVPRVPAPNAENSRSSWETTTDAEGKFRGERIKTGSFVHAISSDNKRAGITEIERDKGVFAMKLLAVGSASGRLLSADGSKPIANQKVGAFFIVPFLRKDELANGDHPVGSPSFAIDCTTDAEGRFRFEYLAPNVEYRVYQGQSIVVSSPIFSFKLEPGEDADLGEVRLLK